MSFPKKLSELCSPAYIYFILSLISMIIISIQNIGNKGIYCVGSYACRVPSTILVFIIKMLYILFWTWVLNLMCKDGHKGIAWALVLFPFIVFFIILLLATSYQKESKKKNNNKQKLIEGNKCSEHGVCR